MINHEYLELFNEGSVRKDIDIVYDTDQHISNSDVVSGTFSLNESAFATKELRFGSLVASELSVKLYNTVPNLMDKEISVSITLDNMASNPLKIGKYKVLEDKPTTDRLYKQIKAYDGLYEVINKEVVSWYEGLLFPMTLKVFRDSFFAFLGIEQENTTLINDDMVVDKTILANSIPGKQVLSAICELNGAIGRMNRDGKFEYVVLDANPSSRITIDNIASKSGSYEDFDCQPISKVQIRQTTDDIGAIVGEDGNTYIMQDNFLVYGKSASDLNAIATNLLSVIKDIAYTPFNIKAIYGNPCYEIGDAITVVTANKTFNSYMFNRTLKGIQAMTDNIKADGIEYYTENLNSANTQIQQLARQTNELSRTVEETKSIVSSLELNNEFTNVALGKEITIEDSGSYPLIEFYAYGKSLQDGEPTPEIPVDIVSVADDGDLVITTTNNDDLSSIATIPLTDSLRGIKVTEGGNYTDETGQQWVCDTLEKYADGSGKHIKRVYSETITEVDRVGNYYVQYGAEAVVYLSRKIRKVDTEAVVISNKALGVPYNKRISSVGGRDDIYRVYCPELDYVTFRYPASVGEITLEQAKADLVGGEIVYALETPIETPLTAEQIAEIEKLQTFNHITHVTTDDIGDIAIQYYKNNANAEVVAMQGNRISKAESSITQNAESIKSKVSKGDVSSEISQEADLISIKGNRFELLADNIEITKDGKLTTNYIIANEGFAVKQTLVGSAEPINVFSVEGNKSSENSNGYSTIKTSLGYINIANPVRLAIQTEHGDIDTYNTPFITEDYTDNAGWHIRKYSNGVVECEGMFLFTNISPTGTFGDFKTSYMDLTLPSGLFNTAPNKIYNISPLASFGMAVGNIIQNDSALKVRLYCMHTYSSATTYIATVRCWSASSGGVG